MQHTQDILQAASVENRGALRVASITQILLERVVVKSEELRQIFDSYCTDLGANDDFDEASDETFDETMARVNGALLPLGMKWEHAGDQLTGNRVWVIRNTAPYAGSTLFSASVVPFPFDANAFRVLKAFASTYFGRASCLGVSKRELRQFKSLTHQDVSDCVDQLLELGWLVDSEGPDRDEPLYLPTAKLYGELRPTLESTYGGTTLLKCSACKKYAWYAATCSGSAGDGRCPERLHISCYNAFYQSHPELPIGACPECPGAIPEPASISWEAN